LPQFLAQQPLGSSVQMEISNTVLSLGTMPIVNMDKHISIYLG
jgi:hypothetical protein